ncbi:hypothetical protein K6119_14790 [Paracrocinitomix mangrovi]|uniref:hypothetical protein n=1 Tax=Paracrocinitomix mangrovi TaxID=2862509 RepID=UPI001C8EF3CF|nr:hypothetical protein [Paracrocinitomix mangrovi]UKN01000.1 hypothetical protein K6119_14790 [Paracrocinitomix mangrovi]
MKLKLRMKQLLVAAVAFTTTGAFAQNVSIKNGESFKVGGFEFVEDVLAVHSDGSATVLLKAGFLGTKFRVLNLNSELTADSKFEIEIPKVDNKKVNYFTAGQYGKNVFFMSTLKDRKSKTYSMYASELDPKTGKFLKHHNPVSLNYDKMIFGRPFEVSRSVDSTKILFVSKYPTGRKDMAKYKLTVVNNDMSEVWSKDIEFSEETRHFDYNGALVDKEGNVHLLATSKMDKDEQKEEGKSGIFADKWKTEMYSYYHKDGKLVHYDFEKSLSDKVVMNIHLTMNDQDQVLAAGFYSDRTFWGQGYSGFYTFRVDAASKEIVSSSIVPFNEELKAELIGERRAQKGKDIPKYEVRKLYPLENGKMAVVTEEYTYTRTESTDANGNTTVSETWLYGNVLVMYLDEKGQMTSYGVLKKRQYCTAKNGEASLMQKLGIGATPGVNELPYYGIATMNVDGNIYVIFNDNPKNPARLEDGKKPKSVRQRTAITELVSFTEDGKMMRNTLFKAKDNSEGYKMPIMPRQSVQYSDHDMIIFGRKKKNLRVLGLNISNS